MKNIKDYKKGDIVAMIEGVIFYYAEPDKTHTYDGKPCHFLTTDIDNKYAYFRVTPYVNNWDLVCREVVENSK